MTTALTTIAPRLPKPANIQGLSDSQWRVLTDAIFPTAKSSEAVMLALDYCRARHLDPFKRPVHVVPMWSKTLRREVETVWPGINELQVTAARSKSWAGMDEPRWGPMHDYTFVNENESGEKTEVKVTAPEWCAVTVYRMIGDERCAFTEPVYWTEAYGRIGRSEIPNDMWRKRPRGQLHKCAKAASLRAGFPEDLGSSYAAEEMEGKEVDGAGPVVDGVAEQQTSAYVETEETSEFMVRAEGALEAEPNGTKWLALLRNLTGACPTLEDLEVLRGCQSVQEGHQKAPKMIKEQIDGLFSEARGRLSAGATAGSKEEAAPPPAQPADTAAPPDPGPDPAVDDMIRRIGSMPYAEFLKLDGNASHKVWCRSLSQEDYARVQKAVADRIAAQAGA